MLAMSMGRPCFTGKIGNAQRSCLPIPRSLFGVALCAQCTWPFKDASQARGFQSYRDVSQSCGARAIGNSFNRRSGLYPPSKAQGQGFPGHNHPWSDRAAEADRGGGADMRLRLA
jgi:hypothetical protein